MRVKLTLDDVYCVTAWGKWPVLAGSNRPQHGMLLEIEKPRGDYRGAGPRRIQREGERVRPRGFCGERFERCLCEHPTSRFRPTD
jgi:hypothetical protein